MPDEDFAWMQQCLEDHPLIGDQGSYPLPPSSVSVFLGPPIWCAWALFRAKVDGFVPGSPDVNLRIVGCGLCVDAAVFGRQPPHQRPGSRPRNNSLHLKSTVDELGLGLISTNPQTDSVRFVPGIIERRSRFDTQAIFAWAPALLGLCGLTDLVRPGAFPRES
jgi:hypothetical protein